VYFPFKASPEDFVLNFARKYFFNRYNTKYLIKQLKKGRQKKGMGIVDLLIEDFEISDRMGILKVSFAVWLSPGELFGDLRRCACLFRFFFPGYEAYRSSFGDPLQTVCLHCPKKSAVPRYHCRFFPWY
jgi:hypothetical protein